MKKEHLFVLLIALVMDFVLNAQTFETLIVERGKSSLQTLHSNDIVLLLPKDDHWSKVIVCRGPDIYETLHVNQPIDNLGNLLNTSFKGMENPFFEIKDKVYLNTEFIKDVEQRLDFRLKYPRYKMKVYTANGYQYQLSKAEQAKYRSKMANKTVLQSLHAAKLGLGILDIALIFYYVLSEDDNASLIGGNPKTNPCEHQSEYQLHDLIKSMQLPLDQLSSDERRAIALALCELNQN